MPNFDAIRDILNNPTDHNLPEWTNGQYDITGENLKGYLSMLLSGMESADDFFNVNAYNSESQYGSSALARAAVPTNVKKLGLAITYKLSDGWYIDQFIGSNISGWGTASNWKALGPVSVSQNTTTGSDGNGTINIGSNDVGKYAGADKMIELVGIAPSGATSNVTQVGDIYYNTTMRLLRRCIEWNTSATDSLYETVPFYKGAIYTYQNLLYVYDGSVLVSIDADLLSYIFGKTVPLSSLEDLTTEAYGQVPDINNSVVGQDVQFQAITAPAITKKVNVEGYLQIKYPTFLSSGGYGSCFVDENNKYISGYSERANPTGSYKVLNIPQNAKYFYIGVNSVLYNNISSYDVELMPISDAIVELSNKLYGGENLLSGLEFGYINLNVGIGNIVDTQRISSSFTKSTIVDCSSGDSFLVGGFGGQSSRLWGFIDAENKLIDVAPSDEHTVQPYYIQAPTEATKIIYQTADYEGYPAYFTKIGDIDYLKNKVLSISQEKPIIDFAIDNDSYNNDGLMLLGMKTNIPNNKTPFNLGYLFCKWNDNKSLFYGVNLKEIKEINAPSNLNNKNLKFAISPKDGSLIMAIRNDRGSLYVWGSVNKNLTTLEFNAASQKPMGWLYNSGCCFDIDESDNEICLFAEYSQSPGNSGGFNIWRGVYPYTDESLWEVVLHVPYVGDDASGITHFHQVRRDPWTGIIYATSGDASAESKWWYSTDHGETFSLLTTGQTSGFEEHICRIINFIFTKDKVYFATDHGTNHCLNSIERNSQTGLLDVTTRVKLVDLPSGQATNFLCYSDFPKGIFMYDRWDTGYGSPTAPIKIQFYSLETNQLIDVAEFEISDTWGGHRGGCYVDYLNTVMETPAMGFDSNSPCIFVLNNPYVSKIGTIYYDILSKVVHTM